MAIRAVLIDFYGTLAREDDMVVGDICRMIAEKSPLVVSPGEVGHAWWERMDNAYRSCYGDRFIPLAQLEQEILDQLVNQFEAKIPPADLAQRVALSRNFPQNYCDGRVFMARLPLKVCVVANGDRYETQRAADYTQIDIPHLVCSEDAQAYKPRQEIFQTALDLLGVVAEETMHVGDSLHYDMEPARSMGMHTVWLNRSGRTAQSTKPDFSCDSLATLRSMIR